ncbi:hypothetical protein [Shouchella clausii]|nr:hypothetical protein [Shouchella clausii]
MMVLEGSEKQVAWGLEIKKDVLEVFESAKPFLTKKIEDKCRGNQSKLEGRLAELQYYENLIKNETSAAFFIDNFGRMFRKATKSQYRDLYLTDLSIVMCSALGSIAQNDDSNQFKGLVAQYLIKAYEEYKYSSSMKMKSIYIKAINWAEKFEEVDGSYYDYVANVYATSKEKKKEIIDELLRKSWRKINTNNDIIVFEKDKHIIRLYRLY